MEIIFAILAIYGLSFLIKDSAGPWGIMSWLRSKLMNNKYVGVFFYKLLDCYFCVGCHAGWIVYLLHEKEWRINLLICWVLAGGAISLIMDAVLGKLNSS